MISKRAARDEFSADALLADDKEDNVRVPQASANKRPCLSSKTNAGIMSKENVPPLDPNAAPVALQKISKPQLSAPPIKDYSLTSAL